MGAIRGLKAGKVRFAKGPWTTVLEHEHHRLKTSIKLSTAQESRLELLDKLRPAGGAFTKKL